MGVVGRVARVAVAAGALVPSLLLLLLAVVVVVVVVIVLVVVLLRLRAFARSLLGHPRGPAPFLAFVFAQFRRANAREYAAALDALAPALRSSSSSSETGPRVCEIGFGAGIGIPALLRLVGPGGGKVFVLEPARGAVRAAHKNFRAAILAGNLDVRRASAEETGLNDASVHAVLTIHCTYFWPDLDRGFREIARILKPGGSFVLVVGDMDEMHASGLGPDVGFRNLVALPELSMRLQRGGFDVLGVTHLTKHVPLLSRLLLGMTIPSAGLRVSVLSCALRDTARLRKEHP